MSSSTSNSSSNKTQDTMFNKPSEPNYVGKVRNVYYPQEL